MIEIKDITFAYGRRTILHDLSLSLEEGKLIALLGPNGSGKTTLLRIIAGTLKPSSGSVRLDGGDIAAMHAKARARRISVVKQIMSAAFAFTVAEVVAMGRYSYKRGTQSLDPQDYKIVHESIGMVGLKELEQRPVTMLSGGELQRVMLAKALCQQSRWMLLDEPVNHLDLKHRRDIMNTVRAHADSGKGALCVLHDIGMAKLYADRAILMKDGRIVFDGAPKQVLTDENISSIYEVEYRDGVLY